MTSKTTQPMTANEKKLTWIVSFSHFITHSYMTLLPAVLGTIAGEYSMSFMDIGIIANIGYFLYGLGAIPVGYLADTFGSKRLLTVGVLGMAIASILVGLATGTATFAVAYGLLGLSASIHHPAGLSLITRNVERRGKALGLHGVLGNVGLFFTPLAAGLSIMLFNSWRAAYIMYGVIGLGFFLILYTTRIEGEPDLVLKKILSWTTGKKAEPPPAPGPGPVQPAPVALLPIALLVLYLGSILSGFIFRGSLTFFPALFQREIHFIAAHEEPVVIAGFATTAVLSLGLIGSWFGGWINDKIKRPELFPVIIFLVVAPTLYAISRYTDSWLLGASCLFSLVYYAWQPSQNYLIAKHARKSSHGMGFGINFFLIFGMGSLATFTGGWVADNYEIDRFYLILAAVALASLFTSLTVFLFRFHSVQLSGWKLTKNE